MNLLLKYIIEGVDLNKEFNVTVNEKFKSELESHLSSKFNKEISFKVCPMNENNYFLILDDDEYKEIFGYEIVETSLYFLEGMYMPEDMSEVSVILKFLSEIINFSNEYSNKHNDDDSEDDTEWDFEWL